MKKKATKNSVTPAKKKRAAAPVKKLPAEKSAMSEEELDFDDESKVLFQDEDPGAVSSDSGSGDGGGDGGKHRGPPLTRRPQ